MNIVASKTREQFPLSYKKIIKKILASSIRLAILAVFLLFYVALSHNEVVQFFKTSASPLSGTVILCVIIFLVLYFILTWLYQRWYFATYFYDLTENYITIKKGPIVPMEINVPYERIQDIYVDQDLWDRFFGLYDVHLSSATVSSGMTAHIDGLEKTAAEGLRAVLLDTVKSKINR